MKKEYYISSSTYCFEKENSRSYVANEKTHCEYLLEGFASDLWYVILNAKNKKEIENYAKKIGVFEELNNFIKELELLGLLKSKKKENYTVPKNQAKLSTKNQLIKFSNEKQQWLIKNGFLSQLTLELTNNCNLNCIHCYQVHKNIEVKFNDIKKIIDDAITIGCNAITLTGGECTLHKDFIKIAEYIRKKRVSLYFLTNAQRLNNIEFLNKITKLYPRQIQISLYSMKPEIHDEITGIIGSQVNTINVIKKLVRENIPVEIAFFQLPKNIDELHDVIEFANNLGISVKYDMKFINNKEKNNSNVQLSDEQIKYILKNKNNPICMSEDDICGLRRFNQIRKNNKNQNICLAGQRFLYVNSKLDLYPCGGIKISLGNLKNNSLIELWNGKKLKDFNNTFKIKNLKECYKEKYCKYCIYCPGIAFYENGFLKKSDISCKISQIYYSINKK